MFIWLFAFFLCEEALEVCPNILGSLCIYVYVYMYMLHMIGLDISLLNDSNTRVMEERRCNETGRL
jgi:hypothetical protein